MQRADVNVGMMGTGCDGTPYVVYSIGQRTFYPTFGTSGAFTTATWYMKWTDWPYVMPIGFGGGYGNEIAGWLKGQYSKSGSTLYVCTDTNVAGNSPQGCP
jgi:hypothetical protein